MEFARRRLQLGENLYYKMLEKILVSEQQRISTAFNSKTVDFSVSSIDCMVVIIVFHVASIFVLLPPYDAGDIMFRVVLLSIHAFVCEQDIL